MKSHLALCTALVLAALSLARSSSAELIYGIAHQGPATYLVSFDSSAPSNLLSASVINNLATNETILGIDFRPATGQLWGLGSSSRLYTIGLNGNAASAGPQFGTLLSGVDFGFDFNPQIDRIRVVSEVNQNLVLNPLTGTLQAVATPLFYGPSDPNFGVDPNVVDSAYDRNVSNTPATQLYGIDSGLNILVTQANSAGTLGTIGPLGVDVAAAGGFDISGASGVAYAALLPANSSQSSLYSINLATGAATNLGVIDGGLVISALTVFAIPEPTTAVMALASIIGLVGCRRRSER